MGPLEIAKLTIEAGEKRYQAWSWWQKCRYGSVQISHPQNRAVVTPGRVEVEGSHKNAKGHFWLITAARDRSSHRRFVERPHEHWSNAGPRHCNLWLVRVSDFAHELFKDIQNRSNKANYLTL